MQRVEYCVIKLVPTRIISAMVYPKIINTVQYVRVIYKKTALNIILQWYIIIILFIILSHIHYPFKF